MLPKTLLLVENNPIIAMDLQRTLQKHGFKVDTCPADGLDMILSIPRQGQRPDLILMNAIMKGFLTANQTARLFQFLYHTPVLFLTGLRKLDLQLMETRNLKHQFLFKPFTRIQLVQAVNQMLSGVVEL